LPTAILTLRAWTCVIMRTDLGYANFSWCSPIELEGSVPAYVSIVVSSSILFKSVPLLCCENILQEGLVVAGVR
jgi:hypothetical protein